MGARLRGFGRFGRTAGDTGDAGDTGTARTTGRLWRSPRLRWPKRVALALAVLLIVPATTGAVALRVTYAGTIEDVIPTLCEHIDELDEPNARGSLIWIVGEYAEKISNADEILSDFADGFMEEFTQVCSSPPGCSRSMLFFLFPY